MCVCVCVCVCVGRGGAGRRRRCGGGGPAGAACWRAAAGAALRRRGGGARWPARGAVRGAAGRRRRRTGRGGSTGRAPPAAAVRRRRLPSAARPAATAAAAGGGDAVTVTLISQSDEFKKSIDQTKKSIEFANGDGTPPRPALRGAARGRRGELGGGGGGGRGGLLRRRRGCGAARPAGLRARPAAAAAGRDLHSGNWGGVVPNPIWTLVHLLGTMKNDRGIVTIDGFYDNVDPPTELEKETLANLPIDVPAIKQMLDLDELDQPLERGFFERLSTWPTFTINGLHGGYGGPGSKTVLPHEAFAKCDIRLVESQTADEIFAKVEAHIRRHAPQVELIRQGSMDPSKTRLDSPFTEPIRRGITVAQGEEPLLVPAMGGSLPDYVFTKTLGIPAFGVPYANADESNHAPNENLEIERFYKGIKTGAAMLTYLGNRP